MRNVSKEINIPWTKVFLGIALTATIAGALFATKTLSGIDKRIADAKEAARPANVKLTKITVPNCTDCFSIDDAVAILKKQKVLVKEEKTVSYNSKEGRELVNKFNIIKLPAYIFTGEINKKNIQNFVKTNGEVKKDTFVFTNINPIFFDVLSGKGVGKVTVTYINDSSCTQCLDLKQTVEGYKNAGVKIVDEKKHEWSSIEGKKLIAKYKITKVPTFLFSPEIDYYTNVQKSWANIGTIEADKTYVARTLPLPYRDIEKGTIAGLVDIIYLTDSSCTDCYKVKDIQRNILMQSFRVAFRSERTVDVGSSEGQGLVFQYKIINAPTIILSSNADEYPQLKSVWKSVGTVEADGTYVFRQLNVLGGIIYKDLSTNQIVHPATQSAVAQ